MQSLPHGTSLLPFLRPTAPRTLLPADGVTRRWGSPPRLPADGKLSQVKQSSSPAAVLMIEKVFSCTLFSQRLQGLLPDHAHRLAALRVPEGVSGIPQQRHGDRLLRRRWWPPPGPPLRAAERRNTTERTKAQNGPTPGTPPRGSLSAAECPRRLRRPRTACRKPLKTADSAAKKGSRPKRSKPSPATRRTWPGARQKSIRRNRRQHRIEPPRAEAASTRRRRTGRPEAQVQQNTR